jgi:hypothetical protein
LTDKVHTLEDIIEVLLQKLFKLQQYISDVFLFDALNGATILAGIVGLGLLQLHNIVKVNDHRVGVDSHLLQVCRHEDPLEHGQLMQSVCDHLMDGHRCRVANLLTLLHALEELE